MRTLCSALALAVALWAPTGCTQKKKTATKDTATAGRSIPKTLTVKLESAGSGARRRLRYQIPAGTTQTLVMDMNTTMKLTTNERKIPEMHLPGMRFSMQLKVLKVDSAGNMHVGFSVPKVQVVEGPGVPERLVRKLRSQLRVLEALRGSWIMTPRGEARDVEMAIPPAVPKAVRQTMQNFRQQLHGLVPPLPAEPVGAGARWVVRMPVSSPGFKAGQQVRYELKALEPKAARLSTTLTQWAPAQDMKVPSAGGATTRLQSLESSGAGTYRTPFTRLSVTSTAQMKMSMSLHVTAGEQQQDMTMGMKVRIHVKPVSGPRLAAPRSDSRPK